MIIVWSYTQLKKSLIKDLNNYQKQYKFYTLNGRIATNPTNRSIHS
jgi:hypothetical protein